MSMQADLQNPELGYTDEGLNLASATTYESANRKFGDATVLPPVAYRSKVFLEIENEKMWTRSWTVIGLLQQIPKAGDLLPYTLGFQGVHVQRERDGSIVARMNRHQHGGCRFVPVQCRTGEQTKCSITSCNYTRDADVMPGGESGENTDEMYKFVGLVPERLAAVKFETWGPFIYINLDPECPPFASEVGDLAGKLKPERLAKMTLTAKLWLDFKCNWKAVGAAVMAGSRPVADVSGEEMPETPANYAESIIAPPWLGGEARLYWLFPNMLLAVTESQMAVALMQATGMAKTLCRVFVLSDAGKDADGEAAHLASQWLAFFKESGALAEALHNDAALRGTPSRPGTTVEDLPAETNFGSYLLNQYLTERLCREHHYYWNAPIMDAAMLMRGIR